MSSKKYLNELEQKVLALVEEAQEKKENAKKFKAKHYFEGQSDAFEQVLLDFKKLKYEFEAHSDESADETGKQETPVRKRGAKKKVESPEERYPEQAALLKEAKGVGVIEQKSSHYYHDDFTTGREPGRVQGRLNVLKELANEEIAQKIREQIAQATQPA